MCFCVAPRLGRRRRRSTQPVTRSNRRRRTKPAASAAARSHAAWWAVSACSRGESGESGGLRGDQPGGDFARSQQHRQLPRSRGTVRLDAGGRARRQRRARLPRRTERTCSCIVGGGAASPGPESSSSRSLVARPSATSWHTAHSSASAAAEQPPRAWPPIPLAAMEQQRLRLRASCANVWLICDAANAAT